ncbi:MAG: hypothetical protein HOY78_22925 [Saccharothrix sp.]|nr:hypothetical protein [Saccharothrix sp.]
MDTRTRKALGIAAAVLTYTAFGIGFASNAVAQAPRWSQDGGVIAAAKSSWFSGWTLVFLIVLLVAVALIVLYVLRSRRQAREARSRARAARRAAKRANPAA